MAKKTNEVIRYQAVDHGILELREQEIVVVYAPDATEEQQEAVLEEASYYAALANRPVEVRIEES